MAPETNTPNTATIAARHNLRPKVETSIPSRLALGVAGTAEADGVHRWRNVVFADPVAFAYLEEDASTIVVERRSRLHGYELYLVEQWATSRSDPTFVITTYTGDPNHSVLAGVLGIPIDEKDWSARLRVYFKAISQYHAVAKETPLGMLMVTNLSSFPSTLTVIPVPHGDIRKHRENFYVNENLKRLGCSGRSGMSLSKPASATQAKFHQLYKTSDRIQLYGAVIELVKLSQMALVMFGKLESEYADGCLCDVTERAINDWWTEIGSEYYNIEPIDGILGPTTVAALIGLLMGARNRLNYFGAPVAKDAFDVFSLKRGTAHFQKAQKLQRTRRLDRLTLKRLHQVTAKAAASEGWAVPRAVKSTVAELGGKGGEMVMGIVGRDKAGIADIETLDIERFVELVHGDRCKWLWHGKPRRDGKADTSGTLESEAGSLMFKKDDDGGYVWTADRRVETFLGDDLDERKEEFNYSDRTPGSAISIQESPTDRELRKVLFKGPSSRKGDSRSGLGRIKDVVSLRGHASRSSRDESGEYGDQDGGTFSPASQTMSPSGEMTMQPSSKAFSWKTKPEEYRHNPPVPRSTSPFRSGPFHGSRRRRSVSPFEQPKSSLTSLISVEDARSMEAEESWTAEVKAIRERLVDNDPSINGSCMDEADLEGPMLETERAQEHSRMLLHRRHSISTENKTAPTLHHGAWWPRQMSFSGAEEAVLSWTSIAETAHDDNNSNAWASAQNQIYLAEYSYHLFDKMSRLTTEVTAWVNENIDNVDALDENAAGSVEEFQAAYYEHNNNLHSMKEHTQQILHDERAHLAEGTKDIEVLSARLEYEIDGLLSKVHDVEDGVAQFERHVEDLEARYQELEDQFNNEGWLHWLVRNITGIGTAPRGAIVLERREQ